MSKERKFVVQFSEDTQNIFLDMKETQTKYGLKRLNSVMLLKSLLEKPNSMLYDFLCATSIGQNPYRRIIRDCDEVLGKMKKTESDSSEGDRPFTIVKNDGKTSIPIIMSEELYNILVKTIQDCLRVYQEELEEQKNIEESNTSEKKSNEENEPLYILLDSEALLLNFVENMPKMPLTILKNNGVYIDGLFDYYDLLQEMYSTPEAEVTDEEDETEKVPKTISDFVTVLSSKYKGISECEILGRGKECIETMRILQKRGKKNVILVGEAGVGKSSIAEKIAFDIANGNCPETLKDNVVLQLNVNATVAGTKYRGTAEERFKYLIEYLEKHENVILFIDEIHMAIGAGEVSADGENDMSNALKPFLASRKAKVIGATTEEEYNKIIESDSAFKRRFKKIVVKEPKSKEVYPMLKNAIKEHKKYHGITISPEMVDYAILISSCFNNNTRNPDRTNDLIDTAMVIAKEKGLKEVNRECILENFDINFEKYKKMDIHVKKSTAYHEAGHYLVWRLSSNILKDEKGIAISIMPAEDYLGITVYDDLSDEVAVSPNKQYFIASLASLLGGRIAEELYTSDINSGAMSDLEIANKKAYDIICNYAMQDSDDYSTYIEDNHYHMLSQKTIDMINQKKSNLLKEASEFAKKILNENKALLNKLVEALLEKGILDENDLEKIFE